EAGKVRLRPIMMTLVSTNGSSMTSVKLRVDAVEQATLRLMIPGGVSPFNLLVNGEGVPLVRSGEKWLFYVTPSPEADEPAEIAFSYAQHTDQVGFLEAPRLDVPLEDLVWDVFVPEGWNLTSSRGDFQWVDSQNVEEIQLEGYLARMEARRAQGKAEAIAELDQGYAWLAAGKQDKAGQVLGKAARNGFLDEASNEDARVQFRNLKMQQAVLGLNTRRQRNYIDNRFNSMEEKNMQLEAAANVNPILQGFQNYDPQQFDRLLVGNSIEETNSLREIASGIVEQQLEVQGAPSSLEVDFVGQGRLLRFTRSLQVKEAESMSLALNLEPEHKQNWVYGSLLALLAGAVLVMGGSRRPVSIGATKG
ncbi:MAG: hypothetical protein ACQKBU_02530, partial [Verrucomicrobiales bacterium]